MLTATGIGSGLDIESLVTQLISAERSPVETRLVARESALTAELSGFGSLKSALSTFQDSISSLNKLSSFGQRTTTSSNTDAVVASANSTAASGSYSLSVSQLASSHSLASTGYASTSDLVGTGTLTIRFGSTDYTSPDPGPESYDGFTVNPEKGTATITIDSENNTLTGVRDAINGAKIGVTAVIVNDESGYRLLIGSDDGGEKNSLEISVTDTGDSNDLDSAGLSALSFNGSATNLAQTVAARDALFTVNGLSIRSSENRASGVIEGLDITLKDVTGTSPVTVTVAQDREAVKSAIQSFVSGYNNYISTVNSLTAYDPETGVAGPLQGDFSARSIASQVRRAITDSAEGFGGSFSSLSELGITTDGDGKLAINSSRFDAALENAFDDIVGVFAAVGRPSDGTIKYITSTAATAVASHDIDITQMATRGQLTASPSFFPLNIDSENNSLVLSVNGVTSSEILLTQGNYASGAELADELQARINGDTALVNAGALVSVQFVNDHFEITSNNYGSFSTIEVLSVDTNTTAQLGFSTGAGVAGIDVAGTIGGVAASGSGQTLKGAVGSKAEGLQLLIADGSTGPRGAVDFSRGIAYQLNTLITSFLATDGLLDSRTEGIQSRIEGIGDQKEVLDRKMEALEIRYRNQFNALDSLLAQLQTTSDFLTQQLASLPGSGQLLNKNN
ncbi:MAG: flagellar hook protein [Porticoccus sp.]|uniref:flagellar filament capping protein FliD n=1 Tax=Porticoccus hydrocarbonoclasticus TaxID=1073414 RepID=UPI00055C00E9|nr:flagellar filament capping protein FliD [Porticoccus hydrocarbonoclasticus]MBG56715.1 flagellar hook protein [Porticoccus sp.]|tara:strand:+ start:2528 stop:4570 length:2043 start_codon:yes stop_codon:yes gene_type:complete